MRDMAMTHQGSIAKQGFSGLMRVLMKKELHPLKENSYPNIVTVSFVDHGAAS